MKNEVMLNPSRFNTLRDTTPQPTTWEAIVTELVSHRHEAATRHYREVCALLAEAEAVGTDTARIEELKEQKQRLKAAQPAFIPSVTLKGGRAAKDITAYTRYIMVDIDDIAPEQFATILERVREERYVFICHTTFSGFGIRVLTKVGVEVMKQNFGQVWQMVNDYYARLTGIAIDRQCKNATRMSVICHDPDVLFRPEAEAMPVSVWMTEATAAASQTKRRVGRPVTAQRAADTVKRLVESDGIAYAPGSHNAYISRCLYWMNRFGVSEANAQNWVLSEFADYEATHHSVASTVHSCYALTAEHGTCSLRDFAQRSGGGKGSSKASIAEMEAFVREWGEFRMNRLINQLEYRRFAPATSYELQNTSDKLQDTRTDQGLVVRSSSFVASWNRMTDQTENSLWRAMQHAGIETEVFRIRTLLQSDFVKDYHPLQEYLDSLPEWDGVTDYIGRLSRMVHCRCTSPEDFDFYFRRWFVGLLAGALRNDVVNHEIFVLLGPQGVYKSSFMRRLLPPELTDYFAYKTNSQRMTKDDALLMTEKLLINFEELDSMQRSELNQLKAFCSADYVDERPAYGRNKVHLPHVASFCGTGNNIQFLTDDTGNRRWLPFEVERIDNPWNITLPYAGIYAQAYALFRQSFRYWFEQAEVDALNDRNRRFEAPNPARELVLMYYRKPTALEKAKYVTASMIVARFGGSIRLNAVQVGRALKELGFEMVHTRHGNFWVVVERNTEEISSQLPEAIEPSCER